MSLLQGVDGLMLVVGAVFILVLFIVVWAGLGVTRVTEEMTDRLSAYGPGEAGVHTAREEQLAKPFAERAIGPVIIRLGNLLRRLTPAGYLEKTQQKLDYAGGPGTLDAPAFAVIKLLTTIAGVFSAFFLVKFGADAMQQIALFGLPIALGFFGPNAWLQRKIDDRRTEMLRALPDILDLLVISVEAGLGFDAALARVVATVPGPLSEEFFRTLQETRVGVSRRDALRHLLDRTDLEELRSFVLAMIQAEAFGVTISRVLRVQADEMRVKRRQRAQEKAFAAPVKLVFPLVFCIFPSLFIVLLGPAAIQISEAFID